MLVVDRRDDHLQLFLRPQPAVSDVWCEQTGPYRLTVYQLSDAQRRLAGQVGAGIRMPTRGADRLQRLISRIAGVLPVHSDLVAGDAAAEARDADSRPVIELDRRGEGIRVRFSVYPLGLTGPRLRPGKGSAALVASVDGTVARCERDLSLERRRLDDLCERCPSLEMGDGDDVCDFPDVGESLEVLDELRALGDEVVVAWKKGKPLSIEAECGETSLRIALQAEAADWFSATGSVQVDETMVLDLRTMLDLLPRRRGRYVQLDDSKFLALTSALTAKLDSLVAFDDNDAAAGEARGAIRLHPVAAGMVCGWSEDIQSLDLDEAGQRRLARARQAHQLEPEVPATFEAMLRAYQYEGFRWMTRLAHWGAGACLADDMGLGKTVQTLAVLVHRAEQGPALVVAPTSVCSGWIEQATQFAPVLRTFVLTGAPDPQDVKEGWQPYDVIVISYTMMLNHIDALADVSFATVVLDEAQAIKNASTQRAKAARRLTADCRIATTGTPVENHLGELWSLMSFLNPGLLGTSKAFEHRFGRGHASQAPERMAQLKSLMAPFILRRKKREVLKELPPRTEIVVEIEPSNEEKAFAEALRRRAVDRFEEADASLGRSAMTILAELTRLRQAACHPALVDPDVGIGSSKLAHLLELVEELITGGHRMLVFSQFVKFLQYVRTAFEESNVKYQYLDGATPRADRDRAVQAFQAGEGDAFLISLKAGGTGLNLTGADYVIHLDPWWNPAVDEQASSRAHRIGQKRPVTIYKLVTKGSVEEKVYALHADKRDLAERILSGTEVSQTPDVETLLSLLRQTS